MFHVKHSRGMLDLRVRPGEYEALAPCLLEETIMRGRRRGRNRPSSEGSSSTVVPTNEAAAHGATTMVEEESPVSLGDVSPEQVADSPPTTIQGAPDSVEEPETQSVLRDDSSSSEVSATVTSPGEVLPPENPPSSPDRIDPDAGERSPTAGSEQPIPAGTPTAEGEADPVVTGTPAEGSTSAPARQAQAASGNSLPRVMAVANQKGGVGKTTTSVNLGAALAELGFRVLVIDLDPQGNATTGLGIDARNFELSMYDVLMRDCSLEDCVEPTSMKNLFVAPATIALAGAEIELVPAFSRELKLRRAIESVIDDFDYVLIDCPPSLGLITVNALAAATEVLVPIQCEYYALEGLSQLMRNVHLVASNLNPQLDISTIVLTMYDARTKLADQVATEVREHFGTKVCRIVIPRTVRLSEAPSFGQPITAFDPASRGAIAYRELAKEVSGGTS